MARQTPLDRLLRRHKGNKTRLARACGVSRQTVHYWIKNGPTRLGDLAIRAALRA